MSTHHALLFGVLVGVLMMMTVGMSIAVRFISSDHLLTSATFFKPSCRAVRPTARMVEVAGTPEYFAMWSIMRSCASMPRSSGSG